MTSTSTPLVAKRPDLSTAAIMVVALAVGMAWPLVQGAGLGGVLGVWALALALIALAPLVPRKGLVVFVPLYVFGGMLGARLILGADHFLLTWLGAMFFAAFTLASLMYAVQQRRRAP